ncbi:MAG: GH92 family glycosyl hydrolase [Pontiellaceae bacterium]|nr:GH92 family glycosyl hydrolase [Pontiellaceae bacterium]MBN2784447.1 GH92 family glycosyl hydrolase [Pontiellaceae bacterium]
MMNRLYDKKRVSGLLAVIAAFAASGAWASGEYPLAEKVNPFIGTSGHGHTYPGVSLPFGMVQLSPDTKTEGWDWCSGYHYSSETIMGFSHTHLDGTGCADLGDFLFMPTVGELQFQPGSEGDPSTGYRSTFSHDQENASAGFYSVLLQDYDIQVELTATYRVGFHKYTFPATPEANVIMDLTHAIGGARIRESKAEIVSDRVIRGYVRKSGWSPDRFMYFVAEFSQPFASSGLVADGTPLDSSVKKTDANKIQCYARFDATENREVMVKVGISAVSWEGARLNLDKECPGWDFEGTCRRAKQAWQDELSRISVKGGSSDDDAVFYTALYRCCLTPNLFMDVDGQYRGTDKQIHQADKYNNYSVFSLWDTFRAEAPLFTIIDQKRANDFVNSMLGKYRQSGLLPVWELHSGETLCMIGYHAIPLIADAWCKGIRDFDAKEALTAMKKSAMQDHQGLREYKALGYAANDKEGQSASRTMEYAYDDWCIAQVAKDLGEKEDYELFTRRSQFYRNLHDRSIGFVRAKDSNGIWRQDFDPDALPADGGREFTEGNSWHYTFFVPQDVNGLIDLFGGDEGFTAKLDELFTRPGKEHVDVSGLIGQYAQGNEPCHNFAYLYAYAGEPWKTQEKVHQIVSTFFTNDPGGVCGNNDCGQMSAWYVFSALGFYPTCPGQPMYVLGTPSFPEAAINLENGKRFKVIAKNLSDKNIYIQSVKLNGRKYTRSYIDHFDVMRGGELVFTMSSTPNKKWASAVADRPVSHPGATLTMMPFIKNDSLEFTDTIAVEIGCYEQGAKIYFTLDGSEPTKDSTPYTGAIRLSDSATIKAKAFKHGCLDSMTMVSNARKLSLKPAVKVDEAVNGLNYTVYQGNFSRVNQLDVSGPVAEGVCQKVTLDVTNLEDNFGIKYAGYYMAPKDGLYIFGTLSDDGSCLYIDDELVVDSDGYHSPQTKRGHVALKAGLHRFKVLYFEGSVSESLEAYVTVPGGEEVEIPASALYRK